MATARRWTNATWMRIVRIGRWTRSGSSRGDDHGPAATKTRGAWIMPAEVSTRCTTPRSTTIRVAVAPGVTSTPCRRAGAADPVAGAPAEGGLGASVGFQVGPVGRPRQQQKPRRAEVRGAADHVGEMLEDLQAAPGQPDEWLQ